MAGNVGKTGKGGQRLLLLVLLALLAGAGAWNYQRNLSAERAVPRPFRGYADQDIEALVAAYEQELDDYQRRYQTLTGRKLDIRNGELLGDRVEEFERVQRISRNTRALVTQLAKRQVSLSQLEQEKKKRAEERQSFKLFLKRLLTV